MHVKQCGVKINAGKQLVIYKHFSISYISLFFQNYDGILRYI